MQFLFFGIAKIICHGKQSNDKPKDCVLKTNRDFGIEVQSVVLIMIHFLLLQIILAFLLIHFESMHVVDLLEQPNNITATRNKRGFS